MVTSACFLNTAEKYMLQEFHLGNTWQPRRQKQYTGYFNDLNGPP